MLQGLRIRVIRDDNTHILCGRREINATYRPGGVSHSYAWYKRAVVRTYCDDRVWKHARPYPLMYASSNIERPLRASDLSHLASLGP